MKHSFKKSKYWFKAASKCTKQGIFWLYALKNTRTRNNSRIFTCKCREILLLLLKFKKEIIVIIIKKLSPRKIKHAKIYIDNAFKTK